MKESGIGRENGSEAFDACTFLPISDTASRANEI